MFHRFNNVKACSIICLLLIGLLFIVTYKSTYSHNLIFSDGELDSISVRNRQIQQINQSCNNYSLTFERRTHCNHKQKEMCYSTNKSLVVSFWYKRSTDKWVSQNILSAFPLHSYDHMIFVHDNSSWNSHPGYKHFMWIHVNDQLRFWYLKRFVLPMLMKSYEFLWIIDDDAKLDFAPLHYQCVIKNLNISLSAPGRVNGAISHDLTKFNQDFKNQIGRWTNFIETGPVAIMSSLAWQCIYTYLDASTGTGWGLDMIWCTVIAEHCVPLSGLKNACAILDAFVVDHQSKGVNSVSDGAPELKTYTHTYNTWPTKQKNLGPLAKDNKLIETCGR